MGVQVFRDERREDPLTEDRGRRTDFRLPSYDFRPAATGVEIGLLPNIAMLAECSTIEKVSECQAKKL
jgi:hypothetical protein